jgi:hypothetical protein
MKTALHVVTLGVEDAERIRLSPVNSDALLIAHMRRDLCDKDAQIDALKAALAEQRTAIEAIAGTPQVRSPKVLHTFWAVNQGHVSVKELLLALEVSQACGHPSAHLRPRYNEVHRLVGLDLTVIETRAA